NLIRLAQHSSMACLWDEGNSMSRPSDLAARATGCCVALNHVGCETPSWLCWILLAGRGGGDLSWRRSDRRFDPRHGIRVTGPPGGCSDGNAAPRVCDGGLAALGLAAWTVSPELAPARVQAPPGPFDCTPPRPIPCPLITMAVTCPSFFPWSARP